MQQRTDNNLDPFLDAAGQPRVVRGVSILSAAPRLVELAGYIGFETIWIEVEHGPASFSEVEAQCMAAEAGGAVPTVRIPDYHRHHVLRALEAGARILVVPLVNDAATARHIVEYGKFPPLGKRGFNLRSRGVHYGLQGIEAEFAAANQRTHLIAQIETPEAVTNLEEICAVEGLSGILVGPGDLSAGYGKPGRFTDPELIETVSGCIRCARALNRHAGILVAPGPMLKAALEAGADLIFCGGDFGDLTKAWQALLASVPMVPATTS